MMKNLTPHDIHIMGQDNKVIATIPATGEVARVSMTAEVVGTLSTHDDMGSDIISSVPVVVSVPGEVYGLPDEVEGDVLIVSRIVRSVVDPSRRDVVVPDDMVRDENGRVVGCRRFSL